MGRCGVCLRDLHDSEGSVVVSVTSETRRLRKMVATTDTLPREAYLEAAPFLRRPFMPEAVRFKVQEVWTDAGPHAIVVPYIDSRLVVERLNLVCPDLWSEDFTWAGGHLWCAMTLRLDSRGSNDQSVTRRDIGDTYGGKGLVSDARKRAAVQFGVGVSLYAVPKVQLDGDASSELDGQPLLRDWREDGKPWLKLTLTGERHCRDLYRRWLLNAGIAAFGKPIDHGNVADCPEMMQTTEPPPGARREPSRSRQRPEPKAPMPCAEPLPPEAELRALLAFTEDGLNAERFACDASMTALGFSPQDRLKNLVGAKDKRGLDALFTRLGNMPKTGDDEQPIENGETA